MAVDLVQLQTDLAKITDNDLQSVRTLVDSALNIDPEEDLADLVVVQVLQAWRANRDVLIQILIATRSGTAFTFTVNTATIATPGFVPAKRWLFGWFNKRKDV